MLRSTRHTATKLHRLILSGILLAVLMASCTSLPQNQNMAADQSQTPDPAVKETSEIQSTPVPSATIPVELSSLKGTGINIIHPWSGNAALVIRDLISQFNQENVWGIHVSEVAGGSTSETARAYIETMQSSDRYNIVVIPTEYLTGWNESGTIIDLSALIANPEWGIPASEKDEFLPQTWQSNTLNDQQIGIPAQVNLQFLVYNQTWAKELGFSSLPQTQDDFYNQICAAAHANNFDNNQDNDGTGGWIINSSSQTILSWINAFDGSQAWTSDKEIELNQDATGQAFSYLRKMFENGCAWNSRVASPFTYFSNRQTLAFSATLPDLMELEETLAFTKNSDEWVILPYPGEEKPAPVMMTGLSYGISKINPTTELASWLFLRWMMLPRHQADLARAAGSIPAVRSAADMMDDFGSRYAWWQSAVKLIPEAHMIPPTAAWRQVRPVLEDSFWQILQPTPLPIPTLLEQMDETIRSLPQ